jgi:dihydropteroate synthase
MIDKNKEIKATEYLFNGKALTFNKPLIMAIVNLTPDSFYDGGKYDGVKDVLRDIEEKLRLGADIIDIGAASSRPGAKEISSNEEWKRLSGVIPEVVRNFPNAILSIDTYRANIAKQSAETGADIINDIGGGTLDPLMFETIAALNLPYILMQLDGTPQTMAANLPYENIVNHVKAHFKKAIEKLHAFGFNKIILDPGFGFGKSLQNNYEILKALSELTIYKYPILAGVSRKSMVNKIIGTNPVTALNGTTVLNTIALINGAGILRVHDVKEAAQAIALTEYYKNIS